MEEILDARDRQAAGRTAPARGLTLVSMEYQKELPDWHHRENKYWEYDILQSHIKNEKNAYFVITRCVDEEMDGILRRNIHHAFQNGAERVYVTDLRQPERLRLMMYMAGMCSEMCRKMWKSSLPGKNLKN